MPIQDFNIYTNNGYAGDLVDSGPRVVQSGVVEGGDIGFGKAVKRGTAGKQIVIGGEAAVFAISQREYNHEASTRPSDGTTKYRETESISLIRQGYLYIKLTGATSINAGEVLHVDTVTGEFTKVAVAGNVIATTNVVADEDGIQDDVIKVRIDIV
jgi:hypothetical protein